MFGKIAIRNIPEVTWQGLLALATRNFRPVEAEARFALQAWVEPQTQADERSARLIEVSARLRALLEQTRLAMPGRLLKASHIAYGIGSSYVEPVENWLSGEVEPSFHDLEKVANFLGGTKEWLQHGDRTMFPVEGTRISENSSEGVTWLLDLSAVLKFPHEKPLSQLHLVRDAHKTGRFAVVKQYGDFKCETFFTPYNISSEVGSGGHSSLTHLSVIFELLDAMYKKRPKIAGVELIKSYILPENDFDALVNGKVHPLSLLKFSHHDRPWWEDFWDKSMFNTKNYWDDWQSICLSVHDAVHSNRNLRGQVELIRSETHPLMLGELPL